MKALMLSMVRYSNNCTCCRYWISQNDHVLVRILLDNSVVVELTSLNGMTRFMLAVRRAHMPMVELLLGERANINIVGPAGWIGVRLAGVLGDMTIAAVVDCRSESTLIAGL